MDGYVCLLLPNVQKSCLTEKKKRRLVMLHCILTKNCVSAIFWQGRAWRVRTWHQIEGLGARYHLRWHKECSHSNPSAWRGRCFWTVKLSDKMKQFFSKTWILSIPGRNQPLHLFKHDVSTFWIWPSPNEHDSNWQNRPSFPRRNISK